MPTKSSDIFQQYRIGIFVTAAGNLAAAIVFFLFSFIVPSSFQFWLRIAALIMFVAMIALILFWFWAKKKFIVKQNQRNQ